MKRTVAHALPPIALAALSSTVLLVAVALCSSVTPHAQASDEPLIDPSLGVTVSTPIISEVPTAPSFDTVGDIETGMPVETGGALSPDAVSGMDGTPSPDDASAMDIEAESSETVPASEVSYPGGAVGFDADGVPVGPDMTHAEESGLPMAGGVSANPAETLLQEAERRFEDGTAPEVLAVDSSTGRLEYEA